jgi:mRNA-degrading endonuclease RelE of RelBE toxin-antitoxin system
VASPRRGKTHPYDIDYAESAVEHLRHLTARDRAIVVDAIERRLRFEPNRDT